MNFTKELPTRPGFYAWRRDCSGEIHTTRVIECDEWGLCCDDGNDTEPLPEHGEWCELVPRNEVVPKGEIETASIEGWTDCDEGYKWNDSRAKRVMEGKE